LSIVSPSSLSPLVFFFQCSPPPPDLHSFPTRRSSDLYADLIVIPLLDAYRRYFGWRMAAYIAAVFYATMVIASLLMDVAFTGLRSEEHTSELQSHLNLVCRLLLEKKNKNNNQNF